MRSFMIIVTVLFTVSARPDIGLKLRLQQQQQEGYNYDKPQDAVISSYNVPQSSIGSLGPSFTSGGNNGGFPSGINEGNNGGLVGENGGLGGDNGGFGDGNSGGNNAGFSSGSNNGGFGSENGGNIGQILFQGTSSSSGLNRPSVQVVEGEPIVHKHFYVHTAPEEPEEQQKAQQIVVRPQKHYKIIFVKAPSYSSSSQAQALAQPKTEEKTLVYVLVKKPEEISQDQQQSENTFVPEKPEVFFIKYNNQEEAQKAVAEIQDKYNSLGGDTQVSQIGGGSSGSSQGGSTSGSSQGGSTSGSSHGGSLNGPSHGDSTNGSHQGGHGVNQNVPASQYLPA